MSEKIFHLLLRWLSSVVIPHYFCYSLLIPQIYNKTGGYTYLKLPFFPVHFLLWHQAGAHFGHLTLFTLSELIDEGRSLSATTSGASL